MRPHIKRKTIWKLTALAVTLLLLNAALCWLLEPYKSSSQEMWENFRAQETVDTVYTGTSQCLQGIDPETIDAKLGSSSYNMATNMQSLANSRAAISAAIEEYGIQKAVLVVDHEILNTSRSDNSRADQSFWHGKAVTENSLSARLADDWSFMSAKAFFGKPASLTYLMPWIYNRTSNIGLNIHEKLGGSILDGTGHRTAKGFQPSDEELDPNLEFITWEEAEEWDETAESLQSLAISEENVQELESIRDLCAENGVELTVIIVPYPNWLSIYLRDQYLAVDQQLAEIFAADGFDFYDFNLILPEYYDTSGNDNYSDVGHMNRKGAERFSSFLADFLAAREGGTQVNEWFRVGD